MEVNNTRLMQLLGKEQKEGQDRLDQLNDDFTLRFKKLQEEMHNERCLHADENSNLKAQLEIMAVERNAGKMALDAIEGDVELRKVIKASPAKNSILRASGLFTQDAHEGWLQIPKEGHLKKNGWLRRYAVLGAESLILFVDSFKSSTPELVIDISTLHHVHPVQPCDILHANTAEVPRIFQILVASVFSAPNFTRSANSSMHSAHGSSDTRPRLPSSSFKASKFCDLITVNGHVFEKKTMKKSTFCNICNSGITASTVFATKQAFECKYCHLMAHCKHIEGSDGEMFTVSPCPGDIAVRILFFMADSDVEQRWWVTRLTNAIKARGERAVSKRSLHSGRVDVPESPALQGSTLSIVKGTPMQSSAPVEVDNGYIDVNSNDVCSPISTNSLHDGISFISENEALV